MRTMMLLIAILTIMGAIAAVEYVKILKLSMVLSSTLGI